MTVKELKEGLAKCDDGAIVIMADPAGDWGIKIEETSDSIVRVDDNDIDTVYPGYVVLSIRQQVNLMEPEE